MQKAKLEIVGAKVYLTLDNPPHNILDIEMMQTMLSHLEEVRSSTAKVVLIKAEGKNFCTGVSVQEHLPQTAEKMIKIFHELCLAVWDFPLPVVAAVHGYIYGGGLELALMADMVFADETAKFGQPEIKLAVFAPVASVYFPYLIGDKKTADLLLTGRTLSAQDALRYGLISDVFHSGEFLAKVEERLDMITQNSKVALCLCKKAMRCSGIDIRKMLLAVERIYLEELMKTDDAKEGLQSFIEKRKPVWKDK